MLGGFPGGNEQRLRNENGRLRREVERLKTDTGVRKYMEEADEKVDKAEKKSRRYFDFWKSAKEQVEIVEKKLKELLKENKTLRNIKKHLEDVVGKLKKENESYIQKIEKLKEKDKEKDAELKEKNQAITELTEQLHKEQDKREVAGRGNGILTSQTPIGREKVIPHNPREKKYEKRGGVEGHTGSYLKPLNESQIHKRVPHPCVKRFCDNCQTELKISDDVIERDYMVIILNSG